MEKRSLLAILLLLLTTQPVLFSQDNRFQLPDFEPFRPFEPLRPYFEYIKYPVPVFKESGETDFEFEQRRDQVLAKNRKIDAENRQMRTKFAKELIQYQKDSASYPKALAEWEVLHARWRQRNANWRDLTRYKDLLETASSQNQTGRVADEPEDYIVNSATLNLRSGPGTHTEVILRLSEGDAVAVISKRPGGWWLVEHRGKRGYVYSQYLTRAEDYSRWEETYLSSGDDPGCFNFQPKYEYDLDNYLKVKVGSNTDVVIKVMNYYSDVCIRYVYIRSGDIYYIRNIPQGVYYLKIAYGKDWRQRVTDEGQCYGKFMRNAIYKKGKETLDFHIRETYDGYQIPLFELSLDVIRTYAADTFRSDSISEAEFNK